MDGFFFVPEDVKKTQELKKANNPKIATVARQTRRTDLVSLGVVTSAVSDRFSFPVG
jgi:hypothetical protein